MICVKKETIGTWVFVNIIPCSHCLILCNSGGRLVLMVLCNARFLFWTWSSFCVVRTSILYCVLCLIYWNRWCMRSCFYLFIPNLLLMVLCNDRFLVLEILGRTWLNRKKLFVQWRLIINHPVATEPAVNMGNV